MKNVICFILLLISISTFASENWEGGQTGNGGNGCWYQDSEGNLSWKTIEELKFWNLISPNASRYDSANNRVPNLRYGPTGTAKTVNLLETKISKRALKRFNFMINSYPNAYEAIMNYSYLLEEVSVVQHEIEGLYEADLSRLFFRCRRFSPAILTQENKGVFIFRPVWDSLSALSMEVLIVHELLRFSQMFNPAFHDLSNNELQYMTAVMFSFQKNKSMALHKILSRIENR